MEKAAKEKAEKKLQEREREREKLETRDARKRVEEDRQRTIYSSIQCTKYEY